MAQLSSNIRMRGTGSKAFMLWTVDPSKVDVVMVVMEGVAEVAVDVMVAVVTNLQPLMVLTFQTPAIHLCGKNGKHWVMGAALSDSYANETRMVATDGDLRVAAEVAAVTITRSAVSVQLKPRIQTLQQTLPLLPVRIMTVVGVMDVGLVEGPMAGAVLDSLGC